MSRVALALLDLLKGCHTKPARMWDIVWDKADLFVPGYVWHLMRPAADNRQVPERLRS